MSGRRARFTIALHAIACALIGLLAALCTPAVACAADGYGQMGFYTKAGSLGTYANFPGDHWSTDGNDAYCLSHGLLAPTRPGALPPAVFTKGWSWESETVSAIALHGYPNTTVIGGTTFDAGSAKACTQLAIWMALGYVDDEGHSTDDIDFGATDAARRIVRAAVSLKNDALSGKLKAPRYTRRYYGGMREGQRVQDMLWVPVTVEVGFTKTSADATVTDGNEQYGYAGACYDIFLASNGSKVASITTDESGHASCTLKAGVEYYAIETKAPAGFELSRERIPFTAIPDGKVSLEDRPGKFSLTVCKEDSATGSGAQAGATLEGAEFRLTSVSNPGLVRTGMTDADGRLTFGDLPLGTVRVVETRAPRGYKLDSTVHTYTVTADDFAAGRIELTPDDDFPEDVIAFDIKIAKFKDDGLQEGSGIEHPARGVAFEIVSNTSGKAVGRIVTDDDGLATTEGLWFGAGSRPESVAGAVPFDAAGYTVREVEETVPDGYERVGDWTIEPDQMVDGTALAYIVRNRALSSRLQIVKEDAETGKVIPLAGFAFQIIDEAGQPVVQETWYPAHETLDTFTTDESGTVTLPQRLVAARYRLREVAAQPPYLLAGEDIAFEVGDTTGSDAPLVTVRMGNRQATGTARITKRCSEDGDALAGAEFDIVAQEDVISPDGTVRAVTGQVVDHVSTGEDGVAEVTGLSLGSGGARYAFVETKPPAGHVLDPTPVPFEVRYEDSETPCVSVEVEKKDAPTVVELDKTVMGEGTPLPGATFELWRVDDEESGETEPDSKKFTTDETGGVRIEHLEAGTYRLRESSAPAGFVTDPEVIEFTVDEAGRVCGEGTHRISRENDFTKVEISKRDIADESEVAGAELELRDAVGDVVDSWTSGEEPHRIERLEAGRYTLSEKRTPRSHDLAEDVEFTVLETGEVQKVAMYDRPISIEGQVDKRQEIADPVAERTEENGDGNNRAPVRTSPDGLYRYSIDFRSTSSTWTDEFTVEDELTAARCGTAALEGIVTPVASGDFDGKLNVWFLTDRAEGTGEQSSQGANATRDDGHENPWLNDESTAAVLGDDARALDYTGWRVWKADVPADRAIELDADELDLDDGERVIAVRLEYGRVEPGFTTRKGNWDRDDLKHEHDDVAEVATGAEKEKDGPVGPVGAVVRMRATAEYVPGTKLENAAFVHLFRNGGGEGLEDHDEDRVTQEPKGTPMPLPQTGTGTAALLLSMGSIGVWTVRWCLRAKKKRLGMHRGDADDRDTTR